MSLSPGENAFENTGGRVASSWGARGKVFVWSDAAGGEVV